MEFNVYFLVILLTFFLFYHLDLVSSLLNLKALEPKVPGEFSDTLKEADYEKSQEYTRINTRFGVIRATFSLGIFLVFWFLGGFQWMDQWVRGAISGEVPRGLLYVSALVLLNALCSLPFEVYHTFVIEERFGFNQTTPKTFAMDRLKGLLLGAILGLPILALILWLFVRFDLAWLYAFIAVTSFSLLMTYLAPSLIMPLFNKFTPMEEGELKEAIQVMADRCQFPLTEVYVMDGSKRSSKANAFFTGIGKNKKIALFDTLVENHTVPELVAVLAHEIGHFKKKHIIQGMVAGIIETGITFYLLKFFLNNEGLFAAFGVQQTSVYLSLIFFGILYTPISQVTSILRAIWSRKHEFEADAYAADATEQPEALIDGLKKLSRDNLSNLTPHPLHVFLNYSHPPVLQRISALRQPS